MKKVNRLPKSVYSSINSSVYLFELPRVVEELIFNSIDAGSTKVLISISTTTCYVKVEDDGSGISRDGLVLLGEKCATSKLQDSSSLDSNAIDFHGKAIGSLSDIALVEVRTKARGRPNSYCKIIKAWKCLFLGIDDQRSSVGTTVVVRDLFYNQPVRRKRLQTSSKGTLHSVKKYVLRTALMHPQVSFRLVDIDSEEVLVCTISSPSPLQLISDVFGNEISSSLHEVSFCDEALKLYGYFSGFKDSFSIKDFQYLYVNSRYLYKSALHTTINSLMSRLCCSPSEPEMHCVKRRKTQNYPAYLLNLCCSSSIYDISFEPSKTIIEFKDWSIVCSFFEQAIQQFVNELVGQPSQGTWKNTNVGCRTSNAKMLEDSICQQRTPNSMDILVGDDNSNFTHERSAGVEICSDLKKSRSNSGLVQEANCSSRTQILDLQYDQMYFAGSYSDMFDSEFGVTFPEVHVSSSTYDFLGPDEKEGGVNIFLGKEFTSYNEPFIIEQCKDFLPPVLNTSCFAEGFSEYSKLEDPLIDSVVFHAKDYVSGLHNQDAVDYAIQDDSGLLNSGFSLFKDVNTSNPSFPVLRKCNAPIITDASFESEALLSPDFTTHEKESNLFDCMNCESLEMGWSFDTLNAIPKGSFQSIDDLDYPYKFVGTSCTWRSSGMTEYKAMNSKIIFSPRSCSSAELDIETSWPISHSSGEACSKGSSESLCHNNMAGSNSGKQKDSHHWLSDRSVKRSKRGLSAPPFYRGKSKFYISTDHLLSLAGGDNSNYSNISNHSMNVREKGGAFHLPNSFISNQDSGWKYLNGENPSFDASLLSPSAIFSKVSSPFKGCHDEPTKDEVVGLVPVKGDDKEHSEFPDMESTEDSVVEEDRNSSSFLIKWREIDSRPPVDDVILDISSGLLHLASNSLTPESINKDCLQDARVLLQLDKKFIPVMAGRVLVILDQHAADERIRLEELRKKVLSGEGTSITYLDKEKDLVLPEMGVEILQRYSDQIRKWGWICNTESTSFERNMNLMKNQSYGIALVAVPCILGINLSEKDLAEYLQQLINTDGSSTIPPSVVRILNFKACRGAIMFGDSLLPSESSLLVEELSKTSLCFQCAHGRPTMAPLVDLDSLHKHLALLERSAAGDPPVNSVWHGLLRRAPSIERARQRLLAAKMFKNNA